MMKISDLVKVRLRHCMCSPDRAMRRKQNTTSLQHVCSLAGYNDRSIKGRGPGYVSIMCMYMYKSA